MQSAQESIQRQLDLRKFLPRLKFLSQALLAQLNWRQKHMMTTMSNKLVLNQPFSDGSDFYYGSKIDIFSAGRGHEDPDVGDRHTDGVLRRL